MKNPSESELIYDWNTHDAEVVLPAGDGRGVQVREVSSIEAEEAAPVRNGEFELLFVRRAGAASFHRRQDIVAAPTKTARDRTSNILIKV